MSAPPIAATMPAQAVAEPGQTLTRTAPRTPVCTTPTATPATAARITPETAGGGDLQARLTAANQRAAELEEQLAQVTAALDAAEHRAADLADRNRELASDLDDALDQLAGHALHAEQERLIRPAAWSPWSASAERGGYER
ncbi:hypothetical protein IU474_06015 [Nocardia otitidiscaviarum]|uniref:hypothetical protein n=1 Tax=Nocardia otitidiscaviarum TaxID=1823 RepID=UPI001895A083|nr:hypothetical protein [Nocardia otitidiscaviarum]MBF6236633.1 hypothetical protein [Nocardia otitidiscaviarum]